MKNIYFLKNFSRKPFRSYIFILSMLIGRLSGFSQSSPGCYFIEFTDKKNTVYSVSDPLKFLSSKSLSRRAKHHIAVTEQDFPVNSWYIDSLEAAGAKVLLTSRWFNSATIKVDTDTVLKRINKLTFVKSCQKVYRKSKNSTQVTGSVTRTHEYDDQNYGESYRQIAMLNGQYLHQKGCKGEGILIAVIDAGFFKADSLQAFKYLFDNHRILATHDFLAGNDSVYEDASHGMMVLSAIAGRIPGKLLGTAPEAEFLLLRSEDASSEYLIEEDAWTSAAEYADSAGADVINSSLGYTTFDDPSMNHDYSQLDGKTTRVTRAANTAFSKGIIVLNSAGNEGNKPWKYISAPADGDSVIAVGAVDASRKRARFSSIGPASDGAVKPNVAAMGQATVVASTYDGEIINVNGTSLSSPVMAGMTACLLGAFPAKTNREIKKVIEMSASQYAMPDDSLGYGIPDFKLAYEMLKLVSGETVKENLTILQLYPNPFVTDITFTYFSKIDIPVKITVTDRLGRHVLDSVINARAGELGKINLGMQHIEGSGLYILTIDDGTKKITQKLIRLRLSQ